MQSAACVILIFTLTGVGKPPGDLPEGGTVMDKVHDVLRDLKDLTADVEIHTPRRQASGNIVLQYVKKEAGEADQPVRVIQKSIVRTQLQTAQGMTIITKINDGEYVWSEYRFRETGKVRVARRKIDKDAPPRDPFQADLHEYVRKLRESYAFRTLRKDTFDDEPVLVLEGTLRATPKKDAKEPPREVLPRGVVLHVARSDHFPRKVEVFVKAKDDGADAPAPDVSVRLTRVRLNQGLKPDTFKYSLPEGAELIDVK